MQQRRLSIVPRSGGMTKLGSMLEMKSPTTPEPIDLIWTCPKCGILQPLALPSGRWIKRSCQCQIQARKDYLKAAEHQEWLEGARIRCFGGWLGDRYVDEDVIAEMCGKTFETFDPVRQSEAYEAAWSYAQNPVGNLLLCGSYGTGKTHLEAAICNYRRENCDKTSLFTSAPQFFRAYSDAMNAPDKTKSIMLIDQAIATPLLVLDDIDKARPTEFRMDTYFEILDERYKAKRPTILSTNREENLADFLGEAVANSRLMRKMMVVEMSGEDYRLEEEL